MQTKQCSICQKPIDQERLLLYEEVLEKPCSTCAECAKGQKYELSVDPKGQCVSTPACANGFARFSDDDR